MLLLLVTGVQVARAQGGDILRGAQIYDANCAVCHGADGQGRVGVNLSQDFPAIDLAAFIRQAVVGGVPGTRMPAWSLSGGGPLNDREIDDVVAFVETLGGGRSLAAPTATPYPVTPVPTAIGAVGDPGRGEALYAENCAVCHGDQGQGRMGATLTTVFAAINPQAYARAAVQQGVPGTMMPAWSQEFGGPLTSADLDDISAYVIGLSGRSSGQPTASAPGADRRGLLAGGLVLLALLLAGPTLLIVADRRKRGAD
ncbi:MAG: c-type cytochrome [Anaerolineae bacterium]|nr:c-type cytochrome [Anaerolineae bacterium]